MGSGASKANVVMTPLEQAIHKDDLEMVTSLLSSRPELLNTPLNPFRPQDRHTPLEYTIKYGHLAVADVLLTNYTQGIKAGIQCQALSLLLSEYKNGTDEKRLLQSFLNRNIHIRSPLKLSRIFKFLAERDVDEMEDLLRIIVANNNRVCHGAVLNSLCNANIKLRARFTGDALGDDIIRSCIKAVFEMGAPVDSYWYGHFTDICLDLDQPRPFKPLCVYREFVRASSRPETLAKILEATLVFKRPVDRLLPIISLFYKAGLFYDKKHRPENWQIRKIATLNKYQSSFMSEFLWMENFFDDLYTNAHTPMSLLQICILRSRSLLGYYNVFYGLKLLQIEFELPRFIKELLLLQDNS